MEGRNLSVETETSFKSVLENVQRPLVNQLLIYSVLLVNCRPAGRVVIN